MKLDKILLSHYITQPFFEKHLLNSDAKWKHVYNKDMKEGCMYYFSLCDTIHYKALQTGDFTNYLEYMEVQPYINTNEQRQEKIDDFKRLVDDFDINKIGLFNLCHLFGEYYTITDGLHRLAIMLHKGIITDEIPDEYFTNNTEMVKAELRKVIGNAMYNDWQISRSEFGYHSFDMHGVQIAAQRNCRTRVNEFRKHFDFKGKNVLDIGCNVGGMMMHVHESKNGVGIDYDNHTLEAGRNISEIFDLVDKYEFILHDFDKDDINVLLSNNILKNFKPDVIFILSLHAWVTNMHLIRDMCNRYKVPIFYEGVPEDFMNTPFKKTLVMPNSFDDITGNYSRQTYYLEYL